MLWVLRRNSLQGFIGKPANAFEFVLDQKSGVNGNLHTAIMKKIFALSGEINASADQVLVHDKNIFCKWAAFL